MDSERKSPSRALRKLAGAALSAVLLCRPFNSSKCKTEARMATARMKLLRNRREAQVRQMRRDIAALLGARQEDTARIRVEHVIREQNVMAANEIIDLFCELIVARLPIIAKQRECPADLKEGISSLIFAAPRCSELPELGRIRDLFEKKYGKDFVLAAADLRPNSGVNHLLIEKLSVKKPSGEVKLKVLKEIAKEYQVEWDTTETEQELLKPPEELIQGPRTFVEASNMSMQTTLSSQNVAPYPVNCSPAYCGDNGGGFTLQFRDAASAACAAAESAERAASAAKAAADLAKLTSHPSDEDEDSETSVHEFTNSSRRASTNASIRSFKKEDAPFDGLKPHGRKVFSSESFSRSNYMEDKDMDTAGVDSRRLCKRNSRAARKVHSDIKFDDSDGLDTECDDGSDMETGSVESHGPPNQPPPRQSPLRNYFEEKEPAYDKSDVPKMNLGSHVHPNMPLDYETLTARFEALKSGKLP